MAHVKTVKSRNRGLRFKDVLKLAAKSYRKQNKSQRRRRRRQRGGQPPEEDDFDEEEEEEEEMDSDDESKTESSLAGSWQHLRPDEEMKENPYGHFNRVEERNQARRKKVYAVQEGEEEMLKAAVAAGQLSVQDYLQYRMLNMTNQQMQRNQPRLIHHRLMRGQ